MQLLCASAADYILPLVGLLGGLGAFLIGVKIMSDSMSQLADSGMKRMFQKIDNKRLLGVGIGTAATAIIQSSAVTTVMVVGFVNAGLMSLYQATTVIMGANIGTTVTAQLAALQSFDFMAYVIILAFAGFLTMSICKSEKGKTIGYMIAGLGLIFLALQFMSSAMAPFKDPDTEVGFAVQNFLSRISNPFLLLVIGIAFTFLLQSSSALTTILISMASAGLIIGGTSEQIGNGALYIILGSNIGTCFTTMIATTNTNLNAKRAAFIHFVFNFLGSMLFFITLIFWKDFMDVTFARWFKGAMGTQLAMFHTFFNVFCTALFLPFTGLFVKLANVVMPEKEGSKIETNFIDNRFLATPSIAIAQAKKEANNMADIVMEACDIAITGFLNKDKEAEKLVLEKLDFVAELNQELTSYMVNISPQRTLKDEQKLSSLYYVLGDILRIGDLGQNVTKYTKKLANEEIIFSESVYVEVGNMYEMIKQLYAECMLAYINKDRSAYKRAMALENEIDDRKRLLIRNHIERLNNGECKAASSSIFVNLVGNIERMADHMTYIAQRSVTRNNQVVSKVKSVTKEAKDTAQMSIFEVEEVKKKEAESKKKTASKKKTSSKKDEETKQK